jgi:hypothetical protein
MQLTSSERSHLSSYFEGRFRNKLLSAPALSRESIFHVYKTALCTATNWQAAPASTKTCQITLWKRTRSMR